MDQLKQSNIFVTLSIKRQCDRTSKLGQQMQGKKSKNKQVSAQLSQIILLAAEARVESRFRCEKQHVQIVGIS